MFETPEERRARILINESPSTPAWQYDLAVALGYTPESWDGMWKLHPDEPFDFRDGQVIAREAVHPHGSGRAPEWVEVPHPIPAGWTVAPQYRFRPPA